MRIRKFRFEDFDLGICETLENLSVVGNLSDAKKLEIFQDFETNPCYNIFVADVGEEVVGAITLLVERKIIHEGGLVGHIEDVAVKKGCEGRGIGKRLVLRALKEAQGHGCYKVILDCSEDKVSFYEKCGFHRYEVCMRVDL